MKPSKQPCDDRLQGYLTAASAALKKGSAREALPYLINACKKYKHVAQAWLLHAIASAQLQDFKTAIRTGQKALKLNPELLDARITVANSMAASGKYAEAAQQYKLIIDSKPDDYSNRVNLGTTLFLSGNPSGALTHLQHALTLNPHHPSLRVNIGSIFLKLGQPLNALEHFEEALNQKPDWVDARIQLADCLKDLGRYRDAALMYEQTLAMELSNANIYQSLANSYLHLGDISAAQSTYRKALQHCTLKAELTACLAETYILSGAQNDAIELLSPLLECDHPSPKVVDVYARASRTKESQDRSLDLIKTILARKDCNTENEKILRYTAGKLLDKQQRYDEAFFYFRTANEILPGTFNIEAEAKKTDRIINAFPNSEVSVRKTSSLEHPPLLFIIGMPRSGTTLVEQILTSHSDAISVGEKNDINIIATQIANGKTPDKHVRSVSQIPEEELDKYRARYIETIHHTAGDAKCIIDKMPSNYLHLGLIEALFPHSSIIHCTRHPYDTCLSIYFQGFSSSHHYANRLEDIGHHYLEYQKIMRHWKDSLAVPILEVQYESLVDNQATMSRKLIEFSGLNWQEECLNFHRTQRVVTTASHDQVTRPIYRSSIQRWKHYEKYISPLQNVL